MVSLLWITVDYIVKNEDTIRNLHQGELVEFLTMDTYNLIQLWKCTQNNLPKNIQIMKHAISRTGKTRYWKMLEYMYQKYPSQHPEQMVIRCYELNQHHDFLYWIQRSNLYLLLEKCEKKYGRGHPIFKHIIPIGIVYDAYKTIMDSSRVMYELEERFKEENGRIQEDDYFEGITDLIRVMGRVYHIIGGVTGTTHGH